MSIVNHSHDFRRPAQRRSSNRSSVAIRPMGQPVASVKRAYVVLLSLTLLAVVFAGVVALRAAILLHAFHY
jgi:hypothetical protein